MGILAAAMPTMDPTASLQATTTIELVRHAKAMARDRWWGKPDRDRPLTDVGVDQTLQISRELHAHGDVVALYASPTVRCTQTLEPLAAATGLPIRTADGLAEAAGIPVADDGDTWVTPAWLAGRGSAFFDQVIAEHAGGRIVACSHGDLIPAVLAHLVGRDGIAATDVRCRKGARWTLEFDGLRCVRATPVPAPS